ncbi:ATP-binding protein [Streptomyces sp. O3]
MWKTVGAPLLGREQESGELARLLAENRLVTVVGGAGVGKSRLAAEVGRLLCGASDGPLPRVVRVRWDAEGGALVGAVGRALAGERAAFGGADVRVLARWLTGGRVLLFLDDVDPVHAECVGLVQRLLMDVPDLRVLVTARRALGLGVERVLRLAPLRTEPAVELFLDRARAALADFRADASALRDAAAVCRTLEGVPLAVELAAAQLTRHSVRDLAELVERRQCWLSSPHPAVRRHRSLRAAVGADYALCERSVRAVWGRASVFAGPFAEQTAVFVCAGGGVEPHQVASCLAQLAGIGVLEPVSDPGGLRRPRYRMTRAAREFGAERLGGAGEFTIAAERHTAHCQRVAAVAESLWSTGSQPQAVRLVRDEQADLRAMLRYARSHAGQAVAALDAVVNLWFWWAVHERAEEGRGHLLALLPQCPPDSAIAARGLWLAAWLTADSDPGEAQALLGRAWPVAVLAGDDATIGRIAHVQGVLALHRGDDRSAAAHFQQAAEIIPALAPGGPTPAVSLAALALAQSAFDPGAAMSSARRALAQPGIRGDSWARVVARYARAYVDHRHGRSGRAWHRAHRALAALDTAVREENAVAASGAAALRQLIADIETGAPGRPRLLSVPRARTSEPVPVLAATRTGTGS